MIVRAPGLVAVVTLAAVCGCDSPGDVSLGADGLDAGTVRADVVTADVVTAEVVTADVLAADVVTVDVVTVDVGVSPVDAGMVPPRMCMTNADCGGACPPTMGMCVCAATPMGLRCAPTCMMPMDCPPGPGGVMLQCRLGVCLP